MPQPNDLSRSLVALDQNSTIIAVVELSQSRGHPRVDRLSLSGCRDWAGTSLLRSPYAGRPLRKRGTHRMQPWRTGAAAPTSLKSSTTRRSTGWLVIPGDSA
jgi:hypothetical protein